MDDRESVGYAPQETKIPKKAAVAAAGMAAVGGMFATGTEDNAANIAKDVGADAIHASIDGAQSLLNKAEARFTPPEFGKTRADGEAVMGDKSFDLLFKASIVPAGLNNEMPPVVRTELNTTTDENIVTLTDLQQMGVDLSRVDAKRIWGPTYPSSASGQETVGDHNYGKWAKFEVKQPDGSVREFYVAENFVRYDETTPPTLEIVVDSKE